MKIEVNLNNLTTEEQHQLTKLVEKRNAERLWKPEEGDTYYTIDHRGTIRSSLWANDQMDKGSYKIGNVFHSQIQGEFESKRLEVIAEMQRIADLDEPPKWDGNCSHYYIYYDCKCEKLLIDVLFSTKCNDIYFTTFERALECINTVGIDRIKKYYFRIEE